MSLFGIGKRPRHRKFDYVPRYYDQEKEEMEARLSKYKKTEPSSTEAIKTRIRGGFKKPISKSFETDDYKKALRKSNRIVFLLLFFSYY